MDENTPFILYPSANPPFVEKITYIQGIPPETSDLNCQKIIF